MRQQLTFSFQPFQCQLSFWLHFGFWFLHHFKNLTRLIYFVKGVKAFIYTRNKKSTTHLKQIALISKQPRTMYIVIDSIIICIATVIRWIQFVSSVSIFGAVMPSIVILFGILLVHGWLWNVIWFAQKRLMAKTLLMDGDGNATTKTPKSETKRKGKNRNF